NLSSAISQLPSLPTRRSADLLVQYLNPGLIRHCKAPFQQFTVEVIIHRLEIVLRTVDDPVCKGSPADLSPVLLPVFFLPVYREPDRKSTRLNSSHDSTSYAVF